MKKFAMPAWIPIGVAAGVMLAMLAMSPGEDAQAQIRKRITRFDAVKADDAEFGTLKAKKILVERADGTWAPVLAPIGEKGKEAPKKGEKGAKGDGALTVGDLVVTGSIKMRSADGKCVLTIASMEASVGVWLEGPKGQVSLYADGGQTYVGVYDQKSIKDGGGCPVALSVSDGAAVQITDGKRFRMLDVGRLLELTEKK